MDLTPEQQAKAKVATIFAALSAHRDTHWQELIRGGFEASASITGGILTAHVDRDGEYAVYVGKHGERTITLVSGSFTPNVGMASVAYSKAQETEKRP